MLDAANDRNLRSRLLRVETLEERRLLSAEPCVAGLEADAFVLSNCPAIVENERPCVENAPSLDNSIYALLAADGQDPDDIRAEYVFDLNGNPSAPRTIYLDFNGRVTQGSFWNDSYGETIVTPAFNLEGSAFSFSNNELRAIYEIWLRVAEDYMPFDVNVTTKEPSLDALIKTGADDESYGVVVAIGGQWSDWYGSNCGGIAAVNSFGAASETPCFIFSENLRDPKTIAEAVSHEVGHTLGLKHDGVLEEEYSKGFSGWAPIMGTGYYQPLTQWSKGEYSGANNFEDDLEIIVNAGLNYRADDHGDSFDDAEPIDFIDSGVIGSGIIERNTDVDFFAFELNGQESRVSVGGLTGVTNLDAAVSVYDETQNLVATYDPNDAPDVSFDVSGWTPGLYYLSVSGAGRVVDGNEIYTDYGSLGAYTISTRLVNDPYDSYEPNDTKKDAYDLGVVAETTTLDSTLAPRPDVDFYRFSLDPLYSGVKITIVSETNAALAVTFESERSTASFTGTREFYAISDDQTLYLSVESLRYSGAAPYRITIEPLADPELTSVELSSSTFKVGFPMTAVLPYEGLNASYQWYRLTYDGEAIAVPGASEKTYIPTSEDAGRVLRVVAVGEDNCFGTVFADSGYVAEQTVWTVGSAEDAFGTFDLTLRQALADAAEGDRIVFSQELDGQTIRLNETLWIDKTISIDASALPNGIALNGGNNAAVANVSSNVEYLCVQGVRFEEGSSYWGAAGLDFNGEQLVLDSCSFVENVGTVCGALAVNSGTATVAKCAFHNDRAIGQNAGSGGAIALAQGAILRVLESEFEGNASSRNGGAIRSEGNLVVENSVFRNNEAEFGGAIENVGDSALVNALIVGNASERGGAGIYSDGDLKVYNCTITDNKSAAGAGGVSLAGGVGAFYNSIVVGNLTDDPSSNPDETHADIAALDSASSYGYFCLVGETAPWTAEEGRAFYLPTAPLFADAERGDYSLAYASQAIDAGSNAYAMSDRDLSGAARIYRNAVDIGAYEYYGSIVKKLDAPRVSVIAVTPTLLTLDVGTVAGADAYALQYADSADFDRAVSINANSGEITICGLTSSASYYVRVKSVNSRHSGADSDWSVVQAITPAPKKLAIPAVKAESSADTIFLTWKTIARAERYMVEYKPNSASKYTVVYVDATECKLTRLVPSTDYTIRVRALGDGADSLNSDRRVINVATQASRRVAIEVSRQILPQYVKNAREVGTLTIVGFESGRSIEFSVDGEPTDAFNVANGALMYSGGLDVGERSVSICVSDGENSAYGAVAFVVTDRTTAAPTNAAADVNAASVVVSWTESADAETYCVELHSASGDLIESKVVVGSSAAFDGLTAKTDYIATIYASAPDASDSDSINVAFTTPAKKKLAIPKVSAAVGSNAILLTWKAIPNASKYLVEYKPTDGKTYKNVYADAPECKLEGLQSGAEYTVRVRACSNNALYANSDRRIMNVTTNVQAPKKLPKTKIALTPYSDSIAVNWTPIANAVKYQIYLKEESDASYKVYGYVEETNCILIDLKPDTAYSVRVRSIGDKIEHSNSDCATASATTLNVRLPALLDWAFVGWDEYDLFEELRRGA